MARPATTPIPRQGEGVARHVDVAPVRRCSHLGSPGCPQIKVATAGAAAIARVDPPAPRPRARRRPGPAARAPRRVALHRVRVVHPLGRPAAGSGPPSGHRGQGRLGPVSTPRRGRPRRPVTGAQLGSRHRRVEPEPRCGQSARCPRDAAGRTAARVGNGETLGPGPSGAPGVLARPAHRRGPAGARSPRRAPERARTTRTDDAAAPRRPRPPARGRAGGDASSVKARRPSADPRGRRRPRGPRRGAPGSGAAAPLGRSPATPRTPWRADAGRLGRGRAPGRSTAVGSEQRRGVRRPSIEDGAVAARHVGPRRAGRRSEHVRAAARGTSARRAAGRRRRGRPHRGGVAHEPRPRAPRHADRRVGRGVQPRPLRGRRERGSDPSPRSLRRWPPSARSQGSRTTAPASGARRSRTSERTPT